MDFERFKKINDEKKNHRVLEGADVDFEYDNPACGDAYHLYLKVADGKIQDAGYTTTGCGFSVAALETAVDMIRGRDLEEAGAITSEAIQKQFEFPPRRGAYPETAADVVRKAVACYREKAGR